MESVSQDKDDEKWLRGDIHSLLALRGKLDVQKDDREAQDCEHDLQDIGNLRMEKKSYLTYRAEATNVNFLNVFTNCVLMQWHLVQSGAAG